MSRIVCLDCGHVHECDTKKSALPPLPPATGPYINTYPYVNPAGGTLTMTNGGHNPAEYTVTAGTTEYNEKRDGKVEQTNCCEPTDSIGLSE